MIRLTPYKKFIFLLILYFSGKVCAQTDTPLTFTGSANIIFSSYRQSETLQSQYEASFFLDVTHLDTKGLAIGFIHQNQGLNNNNDIVNNIMFYNVWYSWFPETLPGKINVALNYYSGSESTVESSNNNSGSNQGRAKPVANISTSFNDSLDITNPILSYINYTKTFYLDVAYARSNYKTSDTTNGNLQVTQWSPAIGFAFNDKYDWLQLRQFNIRLSNDNRTPGVDSTLAHSLSWTHWTKQSPSQSGGQNGSQTSDYTPDNISISLLTGERLYAVDVDSRKVFNVSDEQTGSYIIGADWKSSTGGHLYIYSGYEKYTDVGADTRYNSLFVYIGIKTSW